MSYAPIPETPPQNEPKRFREIVIAKGWEHGPAWLSVNYLLILLLFFLWVLGDTISERHSAINFCGFTQPDGKVAAADAKSSGRYVPTMILALAGYGSQEVTKWLDAQVKRVFAVNSETVTPPAAADQTAVVADQTAVVADQAAVIADQTAVASGESAIASGQSTGNSRETPPGATSA
jgi:hypothetical protein